MSLSRRVTTIEVRGEDDGTMVGTLQNQFEKKEENEENALATNPIGELKHFTRLKGKVLSRREDRAHPFAATYLTQEEDKRLRLEKNP